MKDFTNTPINTGHFSSKGNQFKWLDDNYWYKADYLGYEALAEFVISRLLQKSNVNAIQYDIEHIQYNQNEFIGCRSRNFLLPGQELITLQKLYQSHKNASLVEDIAGWKTEDKIKYVVDFVKETTGLQDFGAYLTALLEMDALFLNEDRHMNNIAVLLNRKDKTYTYCPIFDNGAALFSDTTLSFPLKKDVFQCLEKIEAKPFCRDFDEQLEAAEALYGVQFGYWFDAKDITGVLREAKPFYPAEVITRTEDVLREQLRKYAYLKRQVPLAEQIDAARAVYNAQINNTTQIHNTDTQSKKEQKIWEKS